jgi:hypothetical protein
MQPVRSEPDIVGQRLNHNVFHKDCAENAYPWAGDGDDKTWAATGGAKLTLLEVKRAGARMKHIGESRVTDLLGSPIFSV